MALVCEKKKFDVKMYHTLPDRASEIHRGIGLPSKVPTFESTKAWHSFDPIIVEVGVKGTCPPISLRDFKKIVKIEKQVFDKPLEKASLELCSILRASVGLSEKLEADGTALTNLDGFIADLAGEEVDASELVRAARRRL